VDSVGAALSKSSVAHGRLQTILGTDCSVFKFLAFLLKVFLLPCSPYSRSSFSPHSAPESLRSIFLKLLNFFLLRLIYFLDLFAQFFLSFLNFFELLSLLGPPFLQLHFVSSIFIIALYSIFISESRENP